MKIMTVPFLSILPNANKGHATEAVDAASKVNVQPFDGNQQQLNVKQALKEQILRKLSELQALVTEQGHDNPKVKLIIDKFHNGKKLTSAEIAYLSQHAKGIVDHIERISREREIVEHRMSVAPSKMDVQNVVLLSLQQVAKHPSTEERIVRAAQIADAQYEYMQSEDYRNKPNGPLDDREKQASNRIGSRKDMMHTLMAIVAYEKAKLLTMEQP